MYTLILTLGVAASAALMFATGTISRFPVHLVMTAAFIGMAVDEMLSEENR